MKDFKKCSQKGLSPRNCLLNFPHLYTVCTKRKCILLSNAWALSILLLGGKHAILLLSDSEASESLKVPVCSALSATALPTLSSSAVTGACPGERARFTLERERWACAPKRQFLHLMEHSFFTSIFFY